MKINHNYPYHLVDPSPWPLVSSIAALFTTFGIVLYMHGYETQVFLLCLLPFLRITLLLCSGLELFRRTSTSEQVKKNFKFSWLNNDFNQYLVCFTLLLIFSFFWGIIYRNNFEILIIGVILSGICFSFVIKIKYPSGLTYHAQKKKKNFFQFFKHLLLTLCALTFSLWVVFFGFSFAEIVVESLLPNYFKALFVYLFFIISTLACVIHYGPSMWSRFKLKFKITNFNRANYKICLFYRLHPEAKKDFVAVYLSVFSFINNTPVLFYSLLGYSIRYHNGFEIYWWYVLCLATTLLITTPSFRRYFFSNYGKSSFRMVGWNGPADHGVKMAGLILATSSAYAFGKMFNAHVNRTNQILHDEMEETRRKKHNAEVDAMREKDPLNFEKGEYKYAKLEHKPIASTNWEWPGFFKGGKKKIKFF